MQIESRCRRLSYFTFWDVESEGPVADPVNEVYDFRILPAFRVPEKEESAVYHVIRSTYRCACLPAVPERLVNDDVFFLQFSHLTNPTLTAPPDEFMAGEIHPISDDDADLPDHAEFGRFLEIQERRIILRSWK